MNWPASWEYRVLMIIGLLFVVRLFHITDPPIEISHNWRQTTSLMVGRNFYQQDANVFYPTIDECGNKPGVIGMEFPMLPYSIYLVSEFFGYDHWYGRLINLIVVSVGSWFFFLLLGLYFEKRFAFIATVAFVFSSLFHLARKVLPDPMSLSLVIMGLYYGMTFLIRGGWWRGLLYLVFASLGTLVKIPFGLFLVLMAVPFFNSQNPLNRKLIIAGLSCIILAATYWWYFVWNVHLSETFGQWYNSGRSISEGFVEIKNHLQGFLEKFYFSAFHSYLFFGLSVGGLILSFYKRKKAQLCLLMLLTPLMIVYILISGFLFTHHGYYALVIMPLMAVFVATLLEAISTKWVTVILILCIGESVANQQHDFFIRKEEFVKTQLAEIADLVSEPTDLVGLASNENPNEFYFLNRKGWLVMRHELDVLHLARLKDQGCRFLFMRRGRFDENLPLQRVFENHDYIVFKM